MLEEREKRMSRQRSALVKLFADPDLACGNLPRATKVLIETAAEAIKTERTSIWLFSEDESTLCCIGLYEATGENYSSGDSLRVSDYPTYFNAIRRESRIYADNASSDPRTAELKKPYLVPHGITSMLDAGIFIEGSLKGVFCFEHVGEPRKWHTDEETFASTMAAIFSELTARSGRAETEKVLHEERDQLLSIFDSINEPIYVADPVSYEIVFVNKYLEKLMQRDLVGELCYQAFEGQESPCSFCNNELILKSKDVPHHREHYSASFDRTYLLTDRIIKWSDGRELRLTNAVDITSRKKAELILEQSRDWYRALAEDIPVLIIRITPGYEITYINKIYAEMVGKPSEELRGRDMFQLMSPGECDIFLDKVKLVNPKEPIFSYDYPIGDHLFRWRNRAIYDAKGELKEYFVTGEDITEEHVAQEKLLASEARNRALLKAIPDQMFRYNKDGIYLDAEIKHLDWLTDRTAELHLSNRLIGSSIVDALEPEIAEKISKGIAIALDSGAGQAINYSLTIKGKKRYFEARLVPIGTEEVVAIIRDITDLKETEQALEEQYQFEYMIADISSTFVDMPSEFINDALNYALKRSGEYFDADRSYLFRFSDDGERMTNTHEWCAEGIAPQIERNQNYPVSDTPWWAEMIRSSDLVKVDDLEAQPDILEAEKNDFRTEGIKSFITIPMYKYNRLVGFFGFDAVRGKKVWSDQQVALIRVVAEIIASAMIKHETEEALKESEERYREILATIEEAYYETDLAGNIVFYNEAGLRLFGDYSVEEAAGINYHALYKDPGAAYEVYHRVFLTGKPESGLVLEMIRKDGSIFFGEISITLRKDKYGNIIGFKGIGKDVTERIRYEQKLAYLSLHDQLTDTYNRTFFESELKRLEESGEYPVTIITADLDGLKLVNDTLGHDAGDKLLINCAEIIKDSLRNDDLLARVGGDEFSAILPRTDRVTCEKIVRQIRKSIAAYNLSHQDLPIGISLGVATAEKVGSSLKELFKQSDDMMYRDKLYSSRSSRSKIVRSLLATLAERDYITEGHAMRLEELCLAVGEKINLPSNKLADLALLAQVHDLGKVGIPDHILLNPGPLSAEGWEVMRGHSEKGYRIARSSPDLAGVADLILKHHEHWDGSGYPLGLKGEEIPVECRILAIIDAYDAMTNKRPYNELKTPLEAVKELKEFAGSHFDPELVRVFISVLEDKRLLP